MSLKIIADAKRIVDRGQDLALRSSNRPYSVESDPLTEQKESRGDRALALKTERVSKDIENFVVKIKELADKYISGHCYNYVIVASTPHGNEANLADEDGIICDVLDECANLVAWGGYSLEFILSFNTHPSGIDKSVVEKLGFDCLYDPNCQVVQVDKSFPYNPGGTSPALTPVTPQIERQFQNLSRYLIRAESTHK